MELIDNINKTLAQDLKQNLKINSKVSIAASCFSIYAYQELKEQLENIEELRFIFTSPTFNTEKAKKEKREFYIPKLNRERSLYGTVMNFLRKLLQKNVLNGLRIKLLLKQILLMKTWLVLSMSMIKTTCQLMVLQL